MEQNPYRSPARESFISTEILRSKLLFWFAATINSFFAIWILTIGILIYLSAQATDSDAQFKIDALLLALIPEVIIENEDLSTVFLFILIVAGSFMVYKNMQSTKVQLSIGVTSLVLSAIACIYSYSPSIVSSLVPNKAVKLTAFQSLVYVAAATLPKHNQLQSCNLPRR